MDPVAEAAKEGVTGFLHPEELAKLMVLAEGREVLEVGSYRGLSAWGMAQTAKSVCCVDTFKAADNGQRQTTDEDRGGHLYTTMDAFLNATRRYGNIEVWPVSSEKAAEDIPANRTFDMIFIDAMHTYEDVKADIERWYPRLKDGGVFALHDYYHQDFPGVAQAVNERFGEIPIEQRCFSLAWLYK